MTKFTSMRGTSNQLSNERVVRPEVSNFQERASKKPSKICAFEGYSARKDFLNGVPIPIDERFETIRKLCPELLSKYKR